jgi:hypothetical protein
MKTLIALLNSIALFAFVIGCSGIKAQQPDRDFYILKSFTLDSEVQANLTDTYLKSGLVPALKRQGISSVGVFLLRSTEQDSIFKRYILYPISSLNQMDIVNTGLEKDEEYKTNHQAFLDAPYDNPPFRRTETIILKAFRDMPRLKPTEVEGDRKDRIYELRSYESPTEALFHNKVHMFNEGGEVILFDRLGFNAVFYAEVLAGPRMPNLMYMTTFKDMETRDKLWKSFVDSPEWKALIGNPFYSNNVNKIDIEFLSPMSYSDY